MWLCELLAPASQYRGVNDPSWEGVWSLVDFLGFSYMGSDPFLMVLWPSNLWLSIFTTAPEPLYQVGALKQQWWGWIAVGESLPHRNGGRHQTGLLWKISCKTLHGLKMITKSINSWVLLIARLWTSLVDLHFKLFSRAVKTGIPTEPLALGAGRTAGRQKKGKFGAQTAAMGTQRGASSANRLSPCRRWVYNSVKCWTVQLAKLKLLPS